MCMNMIPIKIKLLVYSSRKKVGIFKTTEIIECKRLSFEDLGSPAACPKTSSTSKCWKDTIDISHCLEAGSAIKNIRAPCSCSK